MHKAHQICLKCLSSPCLQSRKYIGVVTTMLLSCTGVIAMLSLFRHGRRRLLRRCIASAAVVPGSLAVAIVRGQSFMVTLDHTGMLGLVLPCYLLKAVLCFTCPSHFFLGLFFVFFPLILSVALSPGSHAPNETIGVDSPHQHSQPYGSCLEIHMSSGEALVDVRHWWM